MKFILTRELGKLARWLRILGFDALYNKEKDFASLIIQALREDRRIITRKKDIRYLQKRVIVVSSEKVIDQLNEVVRRLGITIEQSKIFTRCTLCNSPLEKADKGDIKKDIPKYVYEHKDNFMQCSGCKKIYWQGSHWGNIKEVVSQCGAR